MDPEFHNTEIETFISECTAENLGNDALMLRAMEDITRENLLHSSNAMRRKLRDYLDSNGVACGKGSGDSIQSRLLTLISNESTRNTHSSTPSSSSHPTVSPVLNTAKRDFLKVNRKTEEQYCGPYDGPIIDTVRRKFIQDCDAFEVPTDQRLSVLHTMLRDDALNYYTEFVLPHVTSITDAFERLQAHFTTPAYKDTYTTEWNTLTFAEMKRKHTDNSSSQLLDLLYQRARELQSLLEKPYESPLLLRDCIIRAVKDEKFYVPLVTTTIPEDPNALHTRLHQCIRQQDTASSKLTPTSSSQLYLLEPEPDDENDESELQLHYNANSPFFKRQIMRGSNSFSTPNYRRNNFNRGRYGYRGRSFPQRPNQRRVTFGPRKNPEDATGRPMLCRFCNSWFHLERDCLEKRKFYSNFSENQDTAQPSMNANLNENAAQYDAIDQPAYEHSMTMDRSLDEYNYTQHHITELQTEDEHPSVNDVLFLSLAYNMRYEFDNPQNFYSMHTRTTPPPSVNDLRDAHMDWNYDHDAIFHGLCLDEGAPHSVVGISQWMAYLRTYHLPDYLLQIKPHKSSITFGGKGKNRVQVRTVGTVIIRIPLPAHSYFDYKSLLIHNDVPMLLGLKTQTKLRAVSRKHPSNPSITFESIGITLPLTLKFGHLYYEGPRMNDYLFSMIELAQVHRNLGHAPAGSVYSALRRAYPIETDATDLAKLQEITKQCKGCQLFSKQPNRYRAVLPDQCVFNYDVAIDVMFISGNPVLHAVCRQTHFSRAAPLPKQDSYTIWSVFMTIWVTPYLGVPHNLWVDQAKAFLSVQFKTLANSLGCNIVPIAVEAHWSLIAERYHDPLRRISRKLIVDHPAAPMELIVDYANLAMSHTIGPEGFTPAILAFGAQPRLPIGNYDQQTQTVTNRMDLMTTARREYEAIVAQLRIRRALHTALPNEAAAELTPGDEVLVYREKIGLQGPYTFLYNDGRLSVVLDDKGREHLFHSTMIKPYTRPNLPISHLLNPTDNSENTEDPIHANISEVVHDENDPRFAKSRQKEYDGIVQKGGVEPIERDKLPRDANFIGNRFVLTIKNPGSSEPIYKARWILQGHQDRYRYSIANDSPMLMRLMFRVVLSIAAIYFKCHLWTRDVEQAYMQSKPLERDVFTEPPPEAQLSSDKVLKIRLPHYGLVEASSCFFDTYYPVFTQKLGMICSAIDPCFLYKTMKGKIHGVTGLASDDSINTGNSEYQQKESEATNNFITRKNAQTTLRFLGFTILRLPTLIEVHQQSHIERLNLLELQPIDQDLFRTVRGQLLFISQSSRPDIAYDVAQLCQVQYMHATKKDLKLLNDTVIVLRNTKDVTLKYPTLNKDTTRINVIVDSGYNTNTGGTSQLGMIIFLTDDTNKCHFVHWSSSKCPRITRSMLASETYAFSTGYDYGVSLRMLFKNMALNLPLYIFTDCKSIFDTITASKRLRELRLMNEIADIRRAYRQNEITNIAWIRSENNIADNLTRHVGNDLLKRAMATGELKFVVEQWVYKDETSKAH